MVSHGFEGTSVHVSTQENERVLLTGRMKTLYDSGCESVIWQSTGVVLGSRCRCGERLDGGC